MADDLDDLLDEVESKFCKDGASKSSGKKTSSNAQQDKRKQLQTSKKKTGDDLSDIIRDICEDDGPDLPPVVPPPTGSPSSTPGLTAHKSKCFTLLLGGTRFSKGLCTVSEQRTCDKLRCTSCDFKVVVFDNYAWDGDCDYLFFRNNVPDFHKLKVKLKTRKGTRAYACQCCWRSIVDLMDLQTDATLKWVCGKHS
ncbi:predicted protein [Nematostella vectensis]|uniref:Cilia- and flagella-associated protein 418 n=1 Tax=Nematostella vectensis TaxID=45351 RepID=A7RHF6_NEMVE|nr:cilia- and flagella-associated protein 418 [Nematostella vectensis]EDO49219.1 predicted protein [Nematostella vectensis]|eukprot:XP_001641282.1 predicted protein [Nematostella vectensis]